VDDFDDDTADEELSEWARGFANANLSDKVPDAGNRAAAYVKKHGTSIKASIYDEICGLAAAHMMHGRGAEVLQEQYEEDFEVEFGQPPVDVPTPVPAPRKKQPPRGVFSPERVQLRARAAVDALCSVPIDPSALAGLLSVLERDALRNCLPFLPPTAASPAAVTQAWQRVLRDQGPYWQGHWLLGRLRCAAGCATDSAACCALAAFCSETLLAAFKSATFVSSDGSHVHLTLIDALTKCSSAPVFLAAWSDYIARMHVAAVASILGLSEDCTAAFSSAECTAQLHMVFDGLLETWGMVMLGRWPRAGLIITAECAEAAFEQVLGDSEDAAGEDPDGSTIDGDAGIGGGMHQTPRAAHVPMAVMNMAGAAVARLLRKLDGPGRRRARAVREAAEREELEHPGDLD
jgi:hypothetical protein